MQGHKQKMLMGMQRPVSITIFIHQILSILIRKYVIIVLHAQVLWFALQNTGPKAGVKENNNL